MDRRIGKTRLHAGMAKDFVQAMGEDGPYTKRVEYPAVTAVTDAGREYICCRDFAMVIEAQLYVLDLPEDFDPETHPDFRWERNMYGSPAYVRDGDEETQIQREREEVW
jgi:hypothetical protein